MALQDDPRRRAKRHQEERRRKEREARKVPFECPICGSIDYNEVVVSRFKPGLSSARQSVPYCECVGCSVLFRNALKFNKAGK